MFPELPAAALPQTGISICHKLWRMKALQSILATEERTEQWNVEKAFISHCSNNWRKNCCFWTAWSKQWEVWMNIELGVIHKQLRWELRRFQYKQYFCCSPTINWVPSLKFPLSTFVIKFRTSGTTICIYTSAMKMLKGNWIWTTPEMEFIFRKSAPFIYGWLLWK